MTQSTGRRDAIKAILGLVPSRGIEQAKALANLDRLDDAALEAMRMQLTRSAEVFGSKPRSSGKEGAARRANARAKLASGFSKLEAASRMLEEYDGAGERPVERAAHVAEPVQPILSAQSETVAVIPRPAVGRVATAGMMTATDTWYHPLLMATVTKAKAPDEMSAEATDTTLPALDRDAAVVPVDEAVLSIDNIRSLIAKEIAGVLELSRVDETHVSLVGELFESLLKDVVIEKYLHVQTTGMIRDILAMAIHQRLGLPETGKFALIYQHVQSRLRSPSASVGTTFLSAGPHVLAETTAIDGFAKMVIRMREYAPDVVVVIKGGGEIAGKLVERTYNGGARFLVMDPAVGVPLLPRRFTSNASRVLVIDDVARTGRTMARGFEVCRDTFGATAIRGMALIGTVDSTTILGDRAFFPTLSPVQEVSVPWSKEGQYHGTAKDHVLGWGKPDSLSIAKRLFERAVGRMVTS